MKALMLYVIMLAGGAAVGAFGVGAYNVFTGAAAVVETVEGGEGTGEEGGEGEEGGQVDGGEEAGTPDTGEGVFAEAGGEGEEEVDADPLDPESAAGDPEDPVQSAEAGGDPVPTGDPASVTATPVVQAPPPDPDSIARMTERYQRLARIFSAMKPDEAAPVLAQLDDAQLEGILLAMQGRNAAPILAEMDPERAAALSRKVLRGN